MLDGIDNHSSPAQMKSDREKDFALRSSGRIVYRYDWDLVHDRPDAVELEIRRTLAEREDWERRAAA
jgi:very-short-patch-repair endonuclease